MNIDIAIDSAIRAILSIDPGMTDITEPYIQKFHYLSYLLQDICKAYPLRTGPSVIDLAEHPEIRARPQFLGQNGFQGGGIEPDQGQKRRRGPNSPDGGPLPKRPRTRTSVSDISPSQQLQPCVNPNLDLNEGEFTVDFNFLDPGITYLPSEVFGTEEDQVHDPPDNFAAHSSFQYWPQSVGQDSARGGGVGPDQGQKRRRGPNSPDGGPLPKRPRTRTSVSDISPAQQLQPCVNPNLDLNEGEFTVDFNFLDPGSTYLPSEVFGTEEDQVHDPPDNFAAHSPFQYRPQSVGQDDAQGGGVGPNQGRNQRQMSDNPDGGPPPERRTTSTSVEDVLPAQRLEPCANPDPARNETPSPVDTNVTNRENGSCPIEDLSTEYDPADASTRPTDASPNQCVNIYRDSVEHSMVRNNHRRAWARRRQRSPTPAATQASRLHATVVANRALAQDLEFTWGNLVNEVGQRVAEYPPVQQWQAPEKKFWPALVWHASHSASATWVARRYETHRQAQGFIPYGEVPTVGRYAHLPTFADTIASMDLPALKKTIQIGDKVIQIQRKFQAAAGIIYLLMGNLGTLYRVSDDAVDTFYEICIQDRDLMAYATTLTPITRDVDKELDAYASKFWNDDQRSDVWKYIQARSLTTESLRELARFGDELESHLEDEM